MGEHRGGSRCDCGFSVAFCRGHLRYKSGFAGFFFAVCHVLGGGIRNKGAFVFEVSVVFVVKVVAAVAVFSAVKQVDDRDEQKEGRCEQGNDPDNEQSAEVAHGGHLRQEQSREANARCNDGDKGTGANAGNCIDDGPGMAFVAYFFFVAVLELNGEVGTEPDEHRQTTHRDHGEWDLYAREIGSAESDKHTDEHNR